MTVSRTREAAEQLGVLERAPDAEPRSLVAGPCPSTRLPNTSIVPGRRQEPAHRVHERGLARAVGADEADDLARVDARSTRCRPRLARRSGRVTSSVFSGARPASLLRARPTAARRPHASDLRLGRVAGAARDPIRSTRSRRFCTIEIKPPGKYMMRMSMPMLDANRLTSSLPSKIAGRPDDERRRARADHRPDTADDRDRHDAQTTRRAARRRVNCAAYTRRRAPGERGDATRDGERDQLGAHRRHGERGRVSRCRAPR